MRNRTAKFLQKPKVIQSWNKYNLFNLRHLRLPQTRTKTFFQQKWTAKSLARAYHGEQIREGQWELMFSRRLRSVVPMNAKYLAENDGTAESAGRGSGLEKAPEPRPASAVPQTPFMQMTFAPLERRLDVAIFRAMFASSTRQARQFVVHGSVTVNGKKMRYPGYLLNPGDLFQVDPERVLFAAGAPKDNQQRRYGRRKRTKGEAQKATEEAEKEETSPEESKSEASSAEGEVKAEGEQSPAEEQAEHAKPEPVEEKSPEEAREALKELLAQAKTIVTGNNANTLLAKRRFDFFSFRKTVRSALAQTSSTTGDVEDLESQFSKLKELAAKDTAPTPKPSEPSSVPISESSPEQTATETAPKEEQEAPKPESSSESAPTEPAPTEPVPTTSESKPKPSTPAGSPDPLLSELSKLQASGTTSLDLSDKSQFPGFTDEDLAVLKQALTQMHENPVDGTKPYATPWRPKDYMSAFAFIPRYLEVNQNICAAVYLRHPVARPGMAEVPTPFPEVINGAAFAWYLRRR
ncbi:hypothetical protein AJ80_05533 [Polytolypa hystricis UAMH7299]|uniref:Small ribosomal subunit protein uS4m n=1 Tax=Polytolypa hystricis (strain UAMH7299) TaxID=1447883 RepID=A0A2B7Y222_POLH7|nr:hypothetical protein AJ80_05533 [Polytolypa hystricis UAMH7299]